MEQLLAVCDGDSLIDIRDRARLLLAFGSGGRRRSEIAKLRVEDLRDESAVQSNDGPLPCMSLRLRQTKTTSADDDARAWLAGRPVVALKEWLVRSGISSGAVFRAIDRWDRPEDRAMTPQSVDLIVKRRCLSAGLESWAYSARVAVGLSDRGGAARNSSSRGDAPVAASARSAGREL